MTNGICACIKIGIMKDVTQKSIPNECPGCHEQLRQVEAEYMAKHNLEKCVKCRAKAEKPIVVKK